jgi:hypothetical protein
MPWRETLVFSAAVFVGLMLAYYLTCWLTEKRSFAESGKGGRLRLALYTGASIAAPVHTTVGQENPRLLAITSP